MTLGYIDFLGVWAVRLYGDCYALFGTGFRPSIAWIKPKNDWVINYENVPQMPCDLMGNLPT